MKNITTAILAKFSIITIVIMAFGIIINNLYLGIYNITDFNVFQSRSLFIGFVFVIFIITHLIYYLALIDTKNILQNTYFEIFYKTIVKLVLLSNTLFFLLRTDIIIPKLKESNFIESTLIILGSISLVFIIGAFGTYFSIYRTDPKHIQAKLFFKYPIIIFCILGSISFFYQFYSFKEFRAIFNYELYFAFFFLFTLSWLWASEKDATKGIYFMNSSFFTKSDREKEYWLEQIFLIIYIVFIISILLNNYSSKIYPYLETKYGGGKQNPITLEYKDKIVSGKVIYYDDEFYYIEKDSTILLIKKVDVRKIYLNKVLSPISSNNSTDSIKVID